MTYRIILKSSLIALLRACKKYKVDFNDILKDVENERSK